MPIAAAQERLYTIEDIYALPDGKRAELIDGRIYDMAPPSTEHQRILNFLSTEINIYIRQNHGDCEIFPAPFAVFLFGDDSKYLEPDISVICDKNKINNRGCCGAPDWIIEILSPGSRRMDHYTKLALYRSAGVREYWIVDPVKKAVVVYDMEHDGGPVIYPFKEEVPVRIYPGFFIQLTALYKDM